MSEPTDTERDWRGREVPKPSSPNEIVTVWEVEPHIADDDHTHLIVRSGPAMRECVASYLDVWLENFNEDELREGVTLKFKLVDMQAEDIPDAD